MSEPEIATELLEALNKIYRGPGEGSATDVLIFVQETARAAIDRANVLLRHRQGEPVALQRCPVCESGTWQDRGASGWRCGECDNPYLASPAPPQGEPTEKGGVAAIFGKWPSDETDEEIAAALDRSPAPPQEGTENPQWSLPWTEIKAACIALADGFVPKDQRTGAHTMGLAKLVAHAVSHHDWHHEQEGRAR